GGATLSARVGGAARCRSSARVTLGLGRRNHEKHVRAGREAEKPFIETLAASRHLDIAKHVEDLKKVAELAPDDYEAHAWAGRACALKRDLAASEAAYKKVLQL